MSLDTTLETMPLKAPRNLPLLVKTAFDKARAAGDLTFFPTQVALLSPNSVPFQLRFSPSLASKPTHPHPHSPDRAKITSPHNPFLEPSPALLVTALGPAHNLILNKFAVVPEHFILATREFAAQTNVLDEQDLAATYACIVAYRDAEGDDGLLGRGELFAFFNSGPHSGASQPHRHIQLLPVERMRDGLQDDEREKWDVLTDRLGSGGGADVDIAFETFCAAVSRSMTPAQLHETYLSLLHRATRAVEAFHHQHRDEKAPPPSVSPPPRAGEEAGISYNIGMTVRTLVVCPRLSEGAVLIQPSTVEKGEVELVGTLTLNGTVLAGTALVKNQREWDALRADDGALRRMLGGIGVPRGV